MNKKLFLFMALTVLLTSAAWAQSANGYGQLTWGATIADTLALYPNLVRANRAVADSRNPANDFSDRGILAYSEQNAGNDIDRRLFFFYQGRLFLVREQYDVSDVDIATIRNQVESVYGQLTRQPTEKGRVRGPAGIPVNVIVNAYMFTCDNLEIEVALIEGSTLFIRRSGIMVEYRNPLIYRQVLAAR